MARGGFERPPRWAVAVMVVGALVIAGGLMFGTGRHTDPLTPQQLQHMQAAEAAANSSAAAVAPISVLIVGDSYTTGFTMGGNGAANWTRLMGQRLLADGYRVSMDVAAGVGSGYTQGGVRKETFQALAGDHARSYDLVVFFGSVNDRGDPGGVQAAAVAAYASVRKTSPNCRLLVIGPPWVNQHPEATLATVEAGVRAAAVTAHADLVDPIVDRWFPDGNRLIGSDGLHPTDVGHRHLADEITPHVERELAAIRAARVARK